jgi:AmiR/NasT family two-component response regulator
LSSVSTPEPRDAPLEVEQLRAELRELRERTAQLQRALESRVVIEQAKGVLAERLGVSIDNAFTLLRRAARSRQMRIHDLAAQVVDARATPPAVAREVARLRREEA